MAENIIDDESNDDKYFVLTPRLVWALCDNPFEYTFWCIVKDIAGKKRQCYISTPDLGTLAMMSTGKAHQCRKSLIEKGLLKGNIVKDPGYPQAVWHLSIPDLWRANITWGEHYLSIKDRIAFKQKQADEGKKLSPRESSKELSRGEKGLSPHEKGLSPHERKNIKKENLKEKKDPDDPVFWLKFFDGLKADMLNGRPEERQLFLERMANLRYAGRENGTIRLYADNPIQAAWLQERAARAFENRFAGYPELAGAKVEFIPWEGEVEADI